jgi:hypothetical protein
VRRAALTGLGALLVAACGSPSAVVRSPSGPPPTASADERAHTSELATTEDVAFAWMAAADPRLAARANTVAPHDVLERVGMEAMLAEDTTAVIRGSSLDLFAFRARAHALDEAAKAVAAFRTPLPEVAPVGSALARPRLEKELLERVIAEERARADDEAKLGDASADLVRGIVALWTPPTKPQEVQDRDLWMQKHLHEVRDSLRDPSRPAGSGDLDLALYPLERLLAPMTYPRGTAALAEVRIAIDWDLRAVRKLMDPERLARGVKVHLGLDVDPAALPARLEKLEARLREVAEAAMKDAGPEGRRGIEARARELLLVERPCPPVPESRVRAMAPPPERAPICGVLRALEGDGAAAGIVALHDDVLLAQAAVMPSPAARTGLLSHPDDDVVETLRRMARERPVVVLGVALAAELLYADDGWEARLAAWRALGDAPLDVVARELGAPRR